MKTIERVIAFATLALIVTVSSSTVFAQTDRQTVVNIPFHFTVSDRAMPAGEYLIRRNRKDTDTVWVIQHKKTGKAVVMLTRAVQALSLIHISEPTRLLSISYAVFCLKKKNTI